MTGLRTVTLSLILLSLCASLAMAGTVAVVAGASYTGGLNGSWGFQYTSGAADLLLESITLDLSATDLRFDTAAGGFGSLSFKDVGEFGGTDVTTGLSSISATGSGLDGGTLVTFTFANFGPGSFFQFSSDVDHANPTLISLRNCSGLTGLSLLACNATNATRTLANNTQLLTAQNVGPNQMAGAVVRFQFAGPYDGTRYITGTYQPVTLADIVNGIARGEGLGAFDSNATISNPEPASLATLGAGLGLLLALGIRRRR